MRRANRHPASGHVRRPRLRGAPGTSGVRGARGRCRECVRRAGLLARARRAGPARVTSG
ncbi:hypothetical protein [Actinophytocola sediminis]